jgi:hypothetical protein
VTACTGGGGGGFGGGGREGYRGGAPREGGGFGRGRDPGADKVRFYAASHGVWFAVHVLFMFCRLLADRFSTDEPVQTANSALRHVMCRTSSHSVDLGLGVMYSCDERCPLWASCPNSADLCLTFGLLSCHMFGVGFPFAVEA